MIDSWAYVNFHLNELVPPIALPGKLNELGRAPEMNSLNFDSVNNAILPKDYPNARSR